jgi:hypothetical protein
VEDMMRKRIERFCRILHWFTDQMHSNPGL